MEVKTKSTVKVGKPGIALTTTAAAKKDTDLDQNIGTPKSTDTRAIKSVDIKVDNSSLIMFGVVAIVVIVILFKKI